MICDDHLSAFHLPDSFLRLRKVREIPSLRPSVFASETDSACDLVTLEFPELLLVPSEPRQRAKVSNGPQQILLIRKHQNDTSSTGEVAFGHFAPNARIVLSQEVHWRSAWWRT
jgi:hypothetical protein